MTVPQYAKKRQEFKLQIRLLTRSLRFFTGNGDQV
jgi:hypothetical protein